jgi:hypothetical protein
LQDHPKFTQIWSFCLKINHLATLRCFVDPHHADAKLADRQFANFSVVDYKLVKAAAKADLNMYAETH